MRMHLPFPARCSAVFARLHIISAKGLIDKNPDPTRADVKESIKNNTNAARYKKIEDAVLLSAKLFRENTEVPATELPGTVGDSIRRIEVVDKTLGTAKYADDIYLPGMLLGLLCARKFSPREGALHRYLPPQKR